MEDVTKVYILERLDRIVLGVISAFVSAVMLFYDTYSIDKILFFTIIGFFYLILMKNDGKSSSGLDLLKRMNEFYTIFGDKYKDKLVNIYKDTVSVQELKEDIAKEVQRVRNVKSGRPDPKTNPNVSDKYV